MASVSAAMAGGPVSGRTRIVLCMDDMVSGAMPSSGAAMVIANHLTSGHNSLTVTYRDILDNIVKLVIGGSVTGTNVADVALILGIT